MAYTLDEWRSWRTHIDQKVADDGRAFILCNGEGEPVAILPPVMESQAGQTAMDQGELDVTFAVDSPGGVHPVVDLLIDEGIGVQDSEGRLQPSTQKTWLIVAQYAGGERARLTYKITFPTLSGTVRAPVDLMVQALDLNYLLAQLPCPSVPGWWHETRYQLNESDISGVPYETPRELASIEMATRAAGYTEEGPAESAIRNIIRMSLDAVNALHGWENDRHLIVDETTTGRESPRVHIVQDDRWVWDTINQPARLAGVNVSTRLWWPGDAPVPYRPHGSTQTTSWDGNKAVAVVTVAQNDEVPA